IVKASFDGKGKNFFPSLTHTKDLVLLSIKGNDYCTGEYLTAIVKQAVANHKITEEIISETISSNKTTFLIADEIYWHNLKKIDSGQDEVAILKNEALLLGDLYFKDNLGSFLSPLGITVEQFNKDYDNFNVNEKIHIINKLAMSKKLNFEIIRWSTWIGNESIQKKLNLIQPLYEKVDGLKFAIDQTVTNFVKRHNEDDESVNLWSYRSRAYLTEESPSIMWLAASLGYNFIIYPGSILPAFSVTKEYFVVEKHTPKIKNGENIIDECKHHELCIHVEKTSRLVNWLEVNFKREYSPEQKLKSKFEKNGLIFFPTRKNKLNKINSSQETSLSLFSEEKDKKETSLVLKTDEGQISSQKEILNAIANGIGRAFIIENLPKENKIVSLPTSPLSDIFQGVTKSLLESNLSGSQQLDFLVNLTDFYLKKTNEIENDSIFKNATI
ncbi:MAG: hypothetical protein HYX60_02105, partial [Legionella longbeachae]|nr:hypothetical protein [Legionella longbeachae]